jgi:hypothetical protein
MTTPRAQATLLYHSSLSLKLIEDPEITNPDVRTRAEPKTGRGVDPELTRHPIY